MSSGHQAAQALASCCALNARRLLATLMIWGVILGEHLAALCLSKGDVDASPGDI
eukprot:CAMPEP_0117659638 /NCGR_PEP_ID=MMETSP0804-20121206/6538_1 /TAXON_ID=1074897 /ORGANISM="Tetraselmis astigmatica, Strain CCMP880" /LENGTH=54 /DNA_ID=CAMNT_0005466307 /DNA_START=549 /DNA_END=713 /DNA_ORIENTATION=+